LILRGFIAPRAFSMGLGTGEVFDGNAVSEKKTALKHWAG